MRGRLVQEGLWLLLYLVFGAVVLSMTGRGDLAGLESNPRCQFRYMIEGTEHKPYIYRAVVPVTVRTIGKLASEEQRQALDEKLVRHAPATLVLDWLFPGWERDLAVEYFASLWVMYASLIGFLYALRYLATGLYRASPHFVRALPLVALFGLPPTFQPYASYIYDFTLLFLFTLGLALLARRKWTAYLVIFALGCLNKETTILLTAIFFFHERSASRLNARAFAQLLAAQVLIFLAVKLGLYFAYADNPGGFTEFHLLRNLLMMNRTSYGFVAAMVVLGVLIFRDWRAKPEVLRLSFLAIIPMLGLSLFLGYFDEVRGYYECYPAMLLLASHSLAGPLGFELRPRT